MCTGVLDFDNVALSGELHHMATGFISEIRHRSTQLSTQPSLWILRS